jgi:capsular polysaccharide export protein
MPRDTVAEAYEAELGAIAPAACGSGAVPRHILLVWGPFGPFTRRLADRLKVGRARCSRVLFSGGDLFDWGARDGLVYRGRPEGFADWVAAAIQAEGVTDVVTYGDSHPYCVAAAEAARRLRRRVHVLEQGYFRPFWITLERNGVNGGSSLPRNPDVYRAEAHDLPDPSDEWLPPLTPPAVWKLALNHAAILLASPLFPHFRAPYQYSILHQAFGHVRRYLDQRLRRRRHARAFRDALDWKGPIFVAILQRPGDSQLRLHSPFPATARFIEQVIASFAAHAPGDARLVLKAHPLDHGVEPHAATVRKAAAAAGVAGRVVFLDFGDLQAIFPRVAGAITVNSTAGLAAIEAGLPTIVLGNAIYDMPGLTHQGGLDRFWTAPEPPERDLYQAFRKVVVARTQVSGAYSIAEGIARAAPEVARRLLAAPDHA